MCVTSHSPSLARRDLRLVKWVAAVAWPSKVIDVTEDSFSLAVKLPCDEAGDILAVS